MGGVRLYDAPNEGRTLLSAGWCDPADAAATRRIVTDPHAGSARPARSRRGDRRRTRHPASKRCARSRALMRGAPARRDSSSRCGVARPRSDRFAARRRDACVRERSGYLRALEAEGTPEAETRVENLPSCCSGEDFAAANSGVRRRAHRAVSGQGGAVSDLDSAEMRRRSGLPRRCPRPRASSSSRLRGRDGGGPCSSTTGLEQDPRAVMRIALCYFAMTRAHGADHAAWAHERPPYYGSRSLSAAHVALPRRDPPPALVERSAVGCEARDTHSA